MTTKKTIRTIPYRRKREGKTNYKKRLELLKSGENRLIIRRTNKHIIFQIASYEPKGDKIIIGMTSKELEKHGWKHSGKNLPSAYLSGLLFAKKATQKGVKKAILDMGLRSPIKGSRIYSALKGVIDGGITIPSSEEVFPSEERIKGQHISEEITKDFEKTKEAIIKS